MSTLSIGRLVVGTKGSVKGRKGYICHVEHPSSAAGYVDARVWIMTETGEVVTDVPEHAFVGRRGRPHRVHSIIASRRSVYSAHEPLAPLTPAWAELFGTVAEAPTEKELWDPETGTGLLPPIDVLVGSHSVMKTSEPTEDTIILTERDEDGITQEQYDTVNEETAQAEKTEDDLERDDCAPKAPKPRLPLVGVDGNAFFLIAMAMNAGKKAGWTQTQLDAFKTEATSGDYDNLLRTLAKHFDILGDADEDEG